MRILSFQSEEILNIVLDEGKYCIDGSLPREKRDYSEDILNLQGYSLVWGFASVKDRDFITSDFANGQLLERFRCEMPLDQSTGLTEFLMIELKVPN